MDNNWVVDNLQNAFTTWNTKMEEMWGLLTQSPETFKGGTIWSTIVTINGGMQAIGYPARGFTICTAARNLDGCLWMAVL